MKRKPKPQQHTYRCICGGIEIDLTITIYANEAKIAGLSLIEADGVGISVPGTIKNLIRLPIR